MPAHFNNIKTPIVQALHTATQSIYMAMAWFTDADILDILIKKRAEGKKVILVLSNDAINFNESYSLDFTPFKAVGGKLLTFDQSFLHHKFTIIDEKILINGSANYTYSGFHKNKENILISDEPSLVHGFLEHFKELIEFYEFEAGLVLSPTVAKVKWEIELAMVQITFLEQELAEAQKYLESYELQYRIRFRDIILQIMELKSRVLEQKAKLSEKQEDIENLANHNFTYKILTDSAPIDSQKVKEAKDTNLQKTLKELFREAVKLCHPDNATIAETNKKQAEQIFIKIKEAYAANDLATIQRLLEDIKTGVAFGQVNYDTLSTYTLEQLLENLKNKLRSLAKNLEALKADKRYPLSQDQKAQEAHFAVEEILLLEQLRMLKANNKFDLG